MKQKYALVVLFALILASSLTSFGCYSSASRQVNEDMSRALTLTMQEQQGDVITRDTIRTFNSHLQIAALRGKATIAVDGSPVNFKPYARCSEATIFSLSDQRPTAVLWAVTLVWAGLGERVKAGSGDRGESMPSGLHQLTKTTWSGWGMPRSKVSA